MISSQPTTLAFGQKLWNRGLRLGLASNPRPLTGTAGAFLGLNAHQRGRPLQKSNKKARAISSTSHKAEME